MVSNFQPGELSQEGYSVIPIQEITLSQFDNAFSTAPKQVNYVEFLHSIKYFNCPIIKQIRATNDAEKNKRLKDKLSRVAINHTFEGGRAAEHARARTPILEIELDAKDNPNINLPEWLKENACKHRMPSLIAAWVTASGKGIVLHYLINPVQFKDSYYSLGKAFEQAGLKIDTATRNSTFLRSRSYDPDVFLNLDAEEYEPPLSAPKREYKANAKVSINDAKFNACIDHIQANEIDITGGYEDWKNIGFALANSFGEDGREYFHLVSQYSPDYKQSSTNKQYTAYLKSKGEGISIGTFYHYCKQHFTLPYVDAVTIGPDEIIKPEQYNSDFKDLITQRLKEEKKLLFAAPTGSGKTTVVKEIAGLIADGTIQAPFTKIAFFVPLLSISDDCFKQYENTSGVSVLKGWGDGTTREDKEADLNAAAQSNFIICTYDSWRKLKPLLAGETVLMVGDEAHYPTDNRNWKTNNAPEEEEGTEYDLAFNEIIRAEYSLLLSATPPNIYALKQQGFYYLKSTPKKVISNPYQQVQYSGKIEHAFTSWLSKQDLNKGKILVRWNGSEERAKVLISHIKKCFALEDKQVGYLRSKYRDGELYKHIIENNTLPPEQVLTFTTSLLDCGFNLRDKDMQFILTLDEAGRRTSTKDFAQWSRREREADGVPVVHFVSTHKPRKGNLTYEGMLERFSTLAAKANAFQEEFYKSPEMFGVQRRLVNDDVDSIIWDGKKYIPNLAKIIGDLDKQKEATFSNENYGHFLADNYNFTLLEPQEAEAVPDALLDAALDARKDEQKSKKGQMEVLYSEHPEECKEAYYYANCHQGKNPAVKRLKKARKYSGKIAPPKAANFYQQYKELFEEGAANCINRWLDVEELGATPTLATLQMPARTYGDTTRRIASYYNLKQKDQFRNKSQRLYQNCISVIVDELTPYIGKMIEANKLVEIVNRIRQEHHYSKLKNAAAKKLIRDHFQVKKKGRYFTLKGRLQVKYLVTQLVGNNLYSSGDSVTNSSHVLEEETRKELAA